MLLVSAGVFALLALTQASPFTLSSYAAKQELEPNCTVAWTVSNGSSIELAMSCRAKGWLAFGIAEYTSGSMQGSDIWSVEFGADGKATLVDRYALAKVYPDADTCQNLELLSAEQTADGMINFALRRALDTGDTTQDRAIRPGPNRVVWAAGNGGSMGYHGKNRGGSEVTFYANKPTGRAATVTDEGETKRLNFTFSDFEVPSNVTSYVCLSYDMNEVLPTKASYHIIAFHPVIDPRALAANVPRVHHVVLHKCSNNLTETNYQNYTDGPKKCPASVKGCEAYVFAFAQGGDSFVLPADVGYPAGGDGAASHFVMQIHYDNPGLVVGHRDSSGVAFSITEKKRKYEAGVLLLGLFSFYDDSNIPAGQTIEYEYDCPEQCTAKLNTSITIFADFAHMHQVGSKMWTTHHDGNGTYLGDVGRSDYYDFGYQRFINLDNPVVVKPGDRLNTHCVYTNPTDKNVSFGMASHEEMCLDVVFYYPAINWTACGYAYVKPPLSPIPMNLTLCGGVRSRADVFPLLRNPSKRDPPGLRLENSYFGQSANGTTCPVGSSTNLNSAPSGSNQVATKPSAAAHGARGGVATWVVAMVMCVVFYW